VFSVSLLVLSLFPTIPIFSGLSETYRAFSTFKAFPASSFAQSSIKMWKTFANISAPTQPQSYLVEDGSPKGGMSTAEGRATTHKFCKGDIRPRGQWPKY
jgi:hypothetical protein